MSTNWIKRRVYALLGIVWAFGLGGCPMGAEFDLPQGEDLPATKSPSPLARERSVVDHKGEPSRGSGAAAYRVTVRLDPQLSRGPLGSFARLDEKLSATLTKLQQRAAVSYEVRVTTDMVDIQLPREHPMGAALIRLSDVDDAVYYQPVGRAAYKYPREVFADLMSGSELSRREELSVTQVVDEQANQEAAAPQRRIAAQPPVMPIPGQMEMKFRYQPAELKAAAWQIRQSFSFKVSGRETMPKGRYGLWHVLLPMLQFREGLLVLESLGLVGAIPLSFKTAVENEPHKAGVVPSFVGEVKPILDSAGAIELSDAVEVSKTPQSSLAGLQSTGPDDLGQLRSGGSSSGTFVVANRSQFGVWIYADGVMLGWVGRGQRFSFFGLKDGYYRFYAVAPTGIRAWGPKDTYAPGRWTIR